VLRSPLCPRHRDHERTGRLRPPGVFRQSGPRRNVVDCYPIDPSTSVISCFDG